MSSKPTAQSAPTRVPVEDLSEEAKQLKTELENAGGVDAPNEYGETPLMVALLERDNARFRMLLDIGASVTCVNEMGTPALAYALKDLEAVRMLLDAGADPNYTYPRSNKNLFHQLGFAGADFSPEVASMLWDRMKTNEAFLNSAEEQSGYTPLSIACMFKNAKAVRWFLDHGAHIDYVGKGFLEDNVVETAMMKAIVWNGDAEVDKEDTECLKLLIKKGADVNWKTKGGVTATMHAAIYGNAKALRVLLDNGADVNLSIEGEAAEDFLDWGPSDGPEKANLEEAMKGYTAAQMAADEGHEECLKMLIAKGAKYTP